MAFPKLFDAPGRDSDDPKIICIWAGETRLLSPASSVPKTTLIVTVFGQVSFADGPLANLSMNSQMRLGRYPPAEPSQVGR